MTESIDETAVSLVTVARAVRTRGLKGELVSELLTDFPERFEGRDELIAISPAGERQVVALENFWFQNGRLILKLAGYDDIESARNLIGYEFAVPESETPSLPQGQYYDWELEGCTVKLPTDVIVGQVNSVIRTGGTEILAIGDASGRELLVPLAEEIVIKIDTESKTVVIDPPEGLLDL